MSEILLRNFHHYDDVRRIDMTTGKLEAIDLASHDRSDTVSGVFTSAEGQVLAVFRMPSGVVIQRGRNQIPITIGTTTQLSESQDGRLLEIIQDGNLEMSIVLPRPSPPVSGFDFTPFVEEEDFDFGLFISNIVNNRDRVQRIFRD